MEKIFQIFLAFYETILLLVFLDIMLIKNQKLKKEKIFVFNFYFLFQCITYLVDYPFFSTSFCYIIFTIGISTFFYCNEIRVKLISASMFVTLNYASKLLTVSLYSLLHRSPVSPHLFAFVLNSQMQIVACLIMTLVIFIIIGMRKINRHVAQYITNIFICILPLSILYMSIQLLEISHTLYLYFAISSILFSYTFILFFITDQIIFSNYNITQSKLMKERLKMQTIYYNDMEQYNKKMSHIKHDMINHLQTIYSMLDNQQISQAQKYLTSFYHNLKNIEPVTHTGNSVVDVILNAKLATAKSNHIEFHNSIVIPPTLPIDSVDLSIILSNLLDNAIEANMKIDEDRFIGVTIHIYKQSLFISVKNHYNGQIRHINSEYFTTKKNTHGHGLGLKNINYVIQKYNGSLNIEHDQKEFTISIIIPLQKLNQLCPKDINK